MKLIVSNTTLLGPFDNIVVNSNHYIANGCIYNFSLLPNHQIVDVDIPSDYSTRKYHLVNGSLERCPDSNEDILNARQLKYLEIDLMREQVNNTTFPYSGKLIRCGPPDRGDINGIVGGISLNNTLPVGWPGGWLSTDGTFITITTVGDFKTFYGAMVSQGLLNFERASQLKIAVSQLNDVAEITKVGWDYEI